MSYTFIIYLNFMFWHKSRGGKVHPRHTKSASSNPENVCSVIEINLNTCSITGNISKTHQRYIM